MATDTPRDIQADPETGDWVVASDLTVVAGADSIVQAVRQRLQFFTGEWFLDLNAGVPFYRDVLVKVPDPNVLQSVFRKALLETPGVLEVLELNIVLDRATRALSVSFRLNTDVGELTAEQEL